jgi:hypothetical protein
MGWAIDENNLPTLSIKPRYTSPAMLDRRRVTPCEPRRIRVLLNLHGQPIGRQSEWTRHTLRTPSPSLFSVSGPVHRLTCQPRRLQAAGSHLAQHVSSTPKTPGSRDTIIYETRSSVFQTGRA